VEIRSCRSRQDPGCRPSSATALLSRSATLASPMLRQARRVPPLADLRDEWIALPSPHAASSMTNPQRLARCVPAVAMESQSPFFDTMPLCISEVATLAPTGPCLHTARFALPSPLYKEPRRQALLAFQHVRTQHSLAALPLRRRRTRQPPTWPLHMAAFAFNRGLSAGRTPRRTARHVLGSRPSHALAHAPVRPARPCSLTRRICTAASCPARSFSCCHPSHPRPASAPAVEAILHLVTFGRPLPALRSASKSCLHSVYTRSHRVVPTCAAGAVGWGGPGGGNRSRPLPHCGCG
jgi:hypothetical protein